ncbi:MAG: hypothetical protein HXX17_01570 [Geobacteraceae bacterium]|nr:hypothetical protein [Geobacteraceae bacterium]
MADLILQIKYGGLGDHLFYSHIPRIAKESGTYERVMLSTKSEFRHPDYRTLVWETNPYFDGFVDADGLYPEFAEVGNDENLLDRIMLDLGLDDGQRWHDPEIYYTPKAVPQLTDRNIYDPNYVSYVGNIHSYDLSRYVRKNKVKIDYKMRQRNIAIDIPVNQELDTPTLEDFCDLILSCNRFYCLSSGAATLAAALKKPATVFFGAGQKPMFHHSKLHSYVLIEVSTVTSIRQRVSSWVNSCKIRFWEQS